MMSEALDKKTLFRGLSALYNSSFPKKCPNCQHIYHSAEEYVESTQEIRGKSGLKASEDDDGTPIVELFRNCHCGSTLLDFFQDRRDTSEQRELFGQLLDQIFETGIERNTARNELLKIMNGQKSELLEELQLSLKK